MSIAVIVPWRGGCPARERAWKWVRGRYADRHPDWEIIEARAPEGPWVKALAVSPAIDACAAEIVIVSDADVWTDGLQRAVDAIVAGAPWAMPHDKVRRLTDGSAAAVLNGRDPRRLPLARPAYTGVFGGGVVVACRATLLEIPMDPRFVGWGREDQAHAMALHYLAGPEWRGHADLMHLWHPPQERPSPNPKRGNAASEALLKRYRDARSSRAQMEALIEEAKHAALQPAQPSVHPPSS